MIIYKKEGIASVEKWKEAIQENTQACGRIYLATTEIHFAKCYLAKKCLARKCIKTAFAIRVGQI